MNNRLTKFVDVAGNASQIIIAGSILVDVYFKFRDYLKSTREPKPNDDGDDSPSPQSTPLAA